MPTYEYECKKCGYNFDVFQAMSDEPVKICPKCGKEVRRLILGGAGVIFKGSGFYVTDKNKEAVSKSKSKPSGASSGEAPGPAVPAGTGDAKAGPASKEAASDPKESPGKDKAKGKAEPSAKSA
ncbi:MAG: zinc ribbon domain-containing protein [Treponema sp.]|nr:zinc ribbon domain-containing protein [Treponema sp.]